MNALVQHATSSEPAGERDAPGPFALMEPVRATCPIVYNSPHSGDYYPPAFIADSALELSMLRRSEDSFVDQLFAAAPAAGAPLLKALYPRAYLDTNRAPFELDPEMFLDQVPVTLTSSQRVAGGLGTIARVVSSGINIYRRKLPFAEAQSRLDDIYYPYHQALSGVMDRTFKHFGSAVLIDCHSMPSAAGRISRGGARMRADIVLGDLYGKSCASQIVEKVEETLRALGYAVVRNTPYAGGYNTETYGTPKHGFHALQIEINRALYMDEIEICKHQGFESLKCDLTRMITDINEFCAHGF